MEGGSQWGGRGTGDTCNVLISIPGQTRTDPPDKRGSLVDAVTAEDSRSGSLLPRQVERVRSPVQTAGELQQYQQPEKQDQQQRGRRPPPYEITPERQCSFQQVWVPNEVALQQQQQQQQPQSLYKQQENVKDASPTLTLAGSAQFCDVSYDTWSNLSISQENVDYSGSNCSSFCSEIKFKSGNVSLTNDINTLNNTPLSASISPRQSRYRRQNRVSSLDEPSNDVVSSRKDASVSSLPQSDDDPDCQNHVNGSTRKLSSRSSLECQNHVVVVSESRNKGLATPDPDPAQISHSIITFQKRSSLEHSSVLNLAAGGEDNSLLKKSWSSRKKKKDKKDSCGKDKSDLSINACNVGANSEKRENCKEENQHDDSGSLPQTSSNTKGSRRLVKRGIGMFPGSNWRRLRNTLKAANEMQSSKKQKHALNREDSFLKKFSTRNHQNVQNTSSSIDDDTRRSYYSSWRLNGRFVIQHDGNFMFYWLGVVTISVLYNLWTCIARQAFREIQQGCPTCWYSLDALFDMIYISDILVQFRTGYLDQGLMVYDSKKLRQKYARSRVIYIDFISLIPLDLLQFAIGIHPMIRFPRFFKIYRPLRFLHMLESRTAYPNLIRVANLTHILFLGAHWFAAFYYMISEAEGFKGEWSYPKPVGEFADVNRKYLRSLFWSTLTLTTIGDIPPPGNSNDLRMSNSAYVFVIVSYLIGVFVFATIVGQVGNVINNRNASRQEFERLLDGAKIYMQTHNVPHNLQKRVQRWYDYVWSRGRLNGCDINSLGLLPDKLKTELAIHVNLETLKKVTIFQECQPEFLHDLVLKMKAYIFTPGDLICRRGEVAREMFIIADGVVEIISESGVMLKRMGAGDFFGEIGILNLDGGINRRTADVRSVGYLELFVLSREDVLAALKDHPEAESIIRDYGQRRLREVEAHRQKVKPLKCRGSTEQASNQVTTPQTVQNRLLQTLRSLNPAVRRQSGQINHVGSPPPPPVPQTASPTDVQRCVNQRGSPVKRAVSTLAKANANMQSDLAVVSLDRSDFSTGSSSRFSEDYPVRRQSFGYIRTAYARFRNVFNRRRCQRRSMDISEARRRELWENRVLFKSMDEQRASLDVGVNTGLFKPGCNVTLNVEDCSESTKLTSGSVISDNFVKDSEKDAQGRTSLSVGVKRGSLLFPGLLDNTEVRKYANALGRVVERKYSEPVAYMPVCTEDLDEKYGHCSKDDLHEATDDRSQIILDVGKIGQVLDRKGSTAKEEDTSVNCTYEDKLNCAMQSTDPPGDTIIYVDNPSSISSTVGNNEEDHANNCNNPVTNGSLLNIHHYENVNSRVKDVDNSNNEASENPSPNHSLESSVTPVQQDSMELENSERYPQDLPRCQSFSSSSPRQRYRSRTPSIRSQGRTLTQTSSESDSIKHHAGCVFHLNATTGETAVPSSSLLTASPSPFTLSCHCDPADNFKKFIGCHLPESLHHKLIKKSVIATSTGVLNTCSQRPRVESIPQGSTGQLEAPQRAATLFPCACAQSGRSFSFPTLAEHREDVKNSGACMPRHPSCQLPEHFLFDEIASSSSPKLAKLRQEDIVTSKVKANGFGGRSHAMSIIQQPTSDFSYQQLTAQINVMQGMIDKRLTLLEEAYASATTKLEYLATSQDMLVQLLKQQLISSQSQERVQACPTDGDDSQAASLI